MMHSLPAQPTTFIHGMVQKPTTRRWWAALATGVIITAVVTSGIYRRANNPTTQWRQITATLATNHWDEAEALLTRWIRRYPADGIAWVRLGSVLYETHRFEEALAVFGKVSEADRAWPIAQTCIGQIARAMGNLADAERAFWRAARCEPTAIEPRIGLVMLFTVQQRPELTRGVLWELYNFTHDVHHLAALTSMEVIGIDDVDALVPLLQTFLRETPGDAWLRRPRG